MSENKNIGTPVGTIRLARIVKYNVSSGKAKVKLSNVAQTLTDGPDIDIFIPNAFYSDNGMFIGGLVKENTPIVVSRGEGGTWYFISFLMTNASFAPKLVPNQLLIQSSDSSKITLDTSNNINLGSDTDKLHLYVNKKDINDTLMSSTFNNNFNFTEASRSITGIIKRETKKLDNYPSALKLESDDYSQRLYTISLDPTATKAPSFINQVKNPPFAESREIVYEFANSYNVQDDLTESNLYKKQGNTNAMLSSGTSDRRQSRADTLSLSLVSPNYLMETVKGTVIDIFGNILDLNRNPIPVGTKNLTLKSNNGDTIPSDAFDNIKAAERKSIAYHFEINARKDLKSSPGEGVVGVLDLNSSADYARNRSRFFLDIDKEGQFKLNVPASSETGNVPLLARYENYSTFGTEENGNPNKLIYREDNLDIFLDSFSTQDIEIKSGTSQATPIDRITSEHIKKGMPFHSITNGLQVYKTDLAPKFFDYQYSPSVDLAGFTTYQNIVSPVINIDGPKANAGGRSASMHFDGSVEFSAGANTVDRQSLWMDLAGGMIGNIGRDLNNISTGLSLDGDMLIQIGGYGISSDGRFKNVNNAYRGGVFDIRVMNEGFTVSVIRIDKNGITMATPNTFSVQARDINMNAERNLTLTGDNVFINDRLVNKYPVVSI